jgi:hypothetical protein
VSRIPLYVAALLAPHLQTSSASVVRQVIAPFDPVLELPLRPPCHAKPHEPPAHILNRKKRRKA